MSKKKKYDFPELTTDSQENSRAVKKRGGLERLLSWKNLILVCVPLIAFAVWGYYNGLSLADIRDQVERSAAEQQQQFEALNQQLTVQAQRQDALLDSLRSINADIELLEDRTAQVENASNELSIRLVEQREVILAEIESLTVQLDRAAVEIQQLEANTEFNDNRIAQLLGSISTITESLVILDQNVRRTSSDLGIIASRVSGLQQGLSGISGDLSNLSNTLLDFDFLNGSIVPSVFTVFAGSSRGSGFTASYSVVCAVGDSACETVVADNELDGVLITNEHVIEQVAGGGFAARTVTLRSNSGGVATGYLYRWDPVNDLAVIYFDKSDIGNPTDLGSSTSYKTGEVVATIGNPRGAGITITQGNISGLTPIGGVDYIRSTTPASPGNSGGPLVNRAGQVLGVTARILSQGDNVSFAVPIDRVCSSEQVSIICN